MGYKLTDIVNELLIEIGESQNNKFARFYQYGLSFLRMSNFNTTGFPKIVELEINDNDTVDLPNDYVQYTKIAICWNGRLYSLGENNSLCLVPRYDDCGNEIAPCNNNRDGFFGNYWDYTFYANHYRNGEYMGRDFGAGADNNCLGYYRIDKNNNRILLSNVTVSCTIVLEYIADVSAIDDDFEVHPFCIEALKDWMMWKYKQRSSRPLGEQQLAQQNYAASNNLMKRMFQTGTIDEWIAIFQSGNKATPKM